MANDFSHDAACVALWTFNAWADGSDVPADIGGTTLREATGYLALTMPETTLVREGAKSAHVTGYYGALYTPTTLPAAFPGRGTTVSFSACFWFRIDDVNRDDYSQGLLGLGSHATLENGSWQVLQVATSKKLRVRIWTGEAYTTQYTSTAALAEDRWYHVGLTYNDATATLTVRLWDDTAGAVIESGSIVGSGNMAAVGNEFTMPIHMGGTYPFRSWWYGYLDEIVVFTDLLTDDEIDEIREGLYGASSSSSSSSSTSSSSSSSTSSRSSRSSSSSFVPLSWPTLSKGVEFDTQELPGAHDVTMPLGNGHQKIRPRYTRRPHRWRISLRLLTLADRLTLEKFHLVECKGSKYSFEFIEQGMDQTWLVKWDPDEPPRFDHEERSPGKYRMTGVLLEDCAGSYGSGHYGAQYYDS